MSTISSFKSLQNNNDIRRGKDCMKKFCESLRKHAMKIINFKKEKTKLLTNRTHIKTLKSAIFVKKSLKINLLKIKKFRNHCHTGE